MNVTDTIKILLLSFRRTYPTIGKIIQKITQLGKKILKTCRRESSKHVGMKRYVLIRSRVSITDHGVRKDPRTF